MIRRTSGRTEALHLLHEERDECALILNRGFGHRIEIGLIGATTTLGHHHEAILIAFASLDINLGGQVATGVHLVVHIQRSVLRIAQIILREGIEDTQREGFLIFKIGPYALSLLTVDDGRTGVLAERQDATTSHLGIAQELQGYVLIVFAGFGVLQYLSHLQVVLTAQHELYVVEGLLCQQGQSLLRDLHDVLAFKL